jgi:TetR/AcrR family transcriptional regulator, transcriptional repressor for nem operon
MNKAERTKQFIIEKTAPIFNVKGYTGTSLSDMTEATGLTKGSIYGNFTDKDEVALACFEHNYKMVKEAIRREMDKYPSYRDKLLVYPEMYGNPKEYLFQTGGCPILNTTVEADDTHPRLRTLAGNALVDWKEKLVQLIEAGKAKGEFKSTTKPDQTALTIIALLEGAIVVAKSTGNRANGKAVIASVRELIEQL